MASVSDNSTSSLNMQFEDIAEKFFKHMLLTSEELHIFGLKERALDGKYYRVDFQTAGNTYAAARDRGAYHPGYNPSTSKEDQIAGYTVKQMTFKGKNVYMSYDFTGQMQAAVKSRKGGYQNLMEFRVEDTMEHMKERVGVKLAMGRLGTIGRIQAVSSTSITLRYAGYNAASVRGYENGIRYIKPGLVLDATTATRTGALRQGVADRGRRVTAVELDQGDNTTGPVVTINTASTNWAAGDYLVTLDERQEAAISSSTDWEDGLYNPLGMLDAIDDGDFCTYYGGLDRTAAGNSTLKALVIEDSSNPGVLRNLTQQIINKSYDQLMNISGGKPDVFYSTFGVQRKFVDFLTITGSTSTANNNPTRFAQTGATKQTIGFNSYEVYPLGARGQLTMMPSRLAPHHTGFLLQRDTAILLQDGKPDYIDYDGNKIRKTTGKDEATADLVWRLPGIVCREPWKNVRIEDLSGDHLAD